MKRKLMALASTGLLALGLVVSPVSDVPASAATPACTVWLVDNSRDGQTYVDMPFGAGPSGSANCQRGPHGKPPIEATEVLQWTMNRCYGRGLTQDGLYGANTITAMRYVQNKVDVHVDGVYGKTTHNAMKFVDVNNVFGPCVLAKKV